MSSVTYQFFVLFLEKEVKLVGGGSVINGATPSSFKHKQLSALSFLPKPEGGEGGGSDTICLGTEH